MNRKKRRLSLSKETLRRLDNITLDQVVGGRRKDSGGGTLSVRNDDCPNTFKPGCFKHTLPRGICL